MVVLCCSTPHFSAFPHRGLCHPASPWSTLFMETYEVEADLSCFSIVYPFMEAYEVEVVLSCFSLVLSFMEEYEVASFVEVVNGSCQSNVSHVIMGQRVWPAQPTLKSCRDG